MLKYEGIAGVPRVFDGFEILRQIGSGAMGAVYLARDIALDRRVAIKLISPRLHDPIARQRLVREARAIARLQHPNIVAIYRIGEVSGQPYIAYEYVDGTSLDQLPRPTDWLTVLKIGIGLSRGIAAAHHRGILHREIQAPNSDEVSRSLPQRGSGEEIQRGAGALTSEATRRPTWQPRSGATARSSRRRTGAAVFRREIEPDAGTGSGPSDGWHHPYPAGDRKPLL